MYISLSELQKIDIIVPVNHYFYNHRINAAQLLRKAVYTWMMHVLYSVKDYSVYAIHRIKFILLYHFCISVCFLTSFGILNLSLYFLLSFIHIFLQIDMLNIVHLHKTIKTMYNISPKQAEYLKNFIVHLTSMSIRSLVFIL